MKISRILGVVGAGLLLAMSLSGCTPKPLPDAERYQYIDNVLEAIDYKTVGDIIEEKVDKGDGILAPSWKKVYYGNDGAFEEIEKRLSAINNDCRKIKGYGQINCLYPRVSVSVFDIKKEGNDSKAESVIYISDGSSGRNN